MSNERSWSFLLCLRCHHFFVQFCFFFVLFFNFFSVVIFVTTNIDKVQVLSEVSLTQNFEQFRFV